MPGWFNTYKFVQNANASTAKAAAAPPRSSVFEYRPASNYLLGGNSTPSSPSSAYAANHNHLLLKQSNQKGDRDTGVQDDILTPKKQLGNG